MYKKALVSVSDKTGLEGFLKPLVGQGLELVSTGGTGMFLKSRGFQVTEVQDLTGFPEVFSGRVKTLHPHIYMALLARSWIDEDQGILNHYKIKPFDLVVANLYPFENKAMALEGKEMVEWIDVGGPGLLRAAAKNYFSITTVCDPKDYDKAQQGTDLEERRRLAAKVFETLSLYDQKISQKLKKEDTEFSMTGYFHKQLRYGENPHQKAKWFKRETYGLHEAEILQGKALSYNNLLDFSSAVMALREFPP